MCILQDCAPPTGAGVWWREDTKWCRYSPQHEDLIKNSIAAKLNQIDLGNIVSAVHPKGARYTVNLQAMEQVALSSGQRRPVMVIELSKPQNLRLEAPPDEEIMLPGKLFGQQFRRPHVHYRDSSGNLQKYDDDIAKALLQAMKVGTKRTLLVPDMRSGGHFVFDLEDMEQYVVAHFTGGRPVISEQAPVKVIVEIPWDPTAVASIALNAEKSMRRKILVLVVQRYRSDEHLDAILPLKARPRTIVSKSISASCSPGNLLFEKFVDSLEAQLESCPSEVFGAVVKQTATEDLNCDGPIQIAFKPADRSRSSDGQQLSKTAFWMSMAAPVAAAHAVVYGCAVQLKICSYLVILPVADAVSKYKSYRENCSGYFEVDDPERQLPLAEVTVR